MRWYFVALKKYAQFRGRASRKEFWLFTLFNLIAGYVIVGLASGLVAAKTGHVEIGFAGPLLYYLATLVPALAVTVRRLHDTVALADGIVNTIGDAASALGYDDAGNAISSVTIGKHLSSAGRAIVTLGEGLYEEDASGVTTFQQDSLAGKNGILFQWAAQAGQALADNPTAQSWLESGVLNAADAERQILTTGAKAASLLLGL